MNRELLFVLTVLDVVLQSQSTVCDPEAPNSTFLLQYKPFEFCGKVTQISSPLIDYMHIKIPPLSKGCLISCVKRTRNAVLVEVINCSSDEELLPGIFFERMDFIMCLTDERIILHGYDSSYWIDFTLRPDVHCLRSKIQTVCTRIVNYTMKYAYRQIIDGMQVSELNINLNKHIWRVLARNQACHGSVGLLLLPGIIVYAFCARFMRYERLLL